MTAEFYKHTSYDPMSIGFGSRGSWVQIPPPRPTKTPRKPNKIKASQGTGTVKEYRPCLAIWGVLGHIWAHHGHILGTYFLLSRKLAEESWAETAFGPKTILQKRGFVP